MPKVIIPHTGNQIQGLVIFDDKDRYPIVRAGSTDYTNPEAETVNNNFIAIRNYVNSLRADLDSINTSIPDASPSVAGKVNLIEQLFAGEKGFEDNAFVGKASVKNGQFKLFNAANAFYAMFRNNSVTTANRIFDVPDKSGVLALLDDLSAKQDLLAADDNVQINRLDAITQRIRNASGSYIDITTPASSFSPRSVVMPAKSGTLAVNPLSLLTPFNARIASITKLNNINSDEAVKIISTDDVQAFVLVKWCLENMSGVGDNINHFTFDSVPAFDLTGYYIYFPQYSRNLKIESMNGATATLISEEGLPTTIGNANTGDLPFIHCNALKYMVVAIPYNPATAALDYSQLKMYTQEYKPNGITAISLQLKLKIGVRYNFIIWAVTSEVYSPSSSVPLESGQYPLIKLSNIDETGASMIATPTRAGFRINISGLDAASAFEICYTSDGVADFSNINHQRLVSKSKVIDVAVSDTRSYSIKMRPLVGGQVVGAVYSASVVSGAGGSLPGDQSLLTVPVSIRTYSGSMVYAGGIATLSSIKSPAGSAVSIGKLNEKMEGSVLKDSAGNEFLLSECIDDNQFTLQNIGTNNFVPITGNFEINTTKRGRMVFFGELNKIDYDITFISFDCDVRTSYSSVMRWYQEANETAYDSLVVNASDKEFKKDTDLKVYSSNDPVSGKRVFIVDFWDASGSPENRGGITGTVSVYGRPRSIARVES